MVRKTPVFGYALKQKLDQMRKATGTAMQSDAHTSTGGISVKKGLLPSAKVGQVLMLKVTAIDDKKVYLEVVR